MYVLENPSTEEWTRVANTARYLGSMHPCEIPENLVNRDSIVAIIYKGHAYLYENFCGRSAATYLVLARGRRITDKRELGCREHGPRTS